MGGKRENLALTLVQVNAKSSICGNRLERIRMSLCGFFEYISVDLGEKGAMIVHMRRSGNLDMADHLRFRAMYVILPKRRCDE